MSTGIVVVIVVAVIVVAALVIVSMVAVRRRRLQQRFGPEYDRVVGESDSKLKADAELTERERRVRGLDIQPLTESARTSYADQWAGIQEAFVDAPADAVAGSQLLVAAVMSRGVLVLAAAKIRLPLGFADELFGFADREAGIFCEVFRAFAGQHDACLG